MRVSDVVAQYIAYKRSLGVRSNTGAGTLKSFCCYVRHIPLSQIEPAQVRAFLDGRGPAQAAFLLARCTLQRMSALLAVSSATGNPLASRP
jgi:hypothetical protein